MSLLSIQAAASINTRGATVIEITGTDPLIAFTGMADGQIVTLVSASANKLTVDGNLKTVSTALTADRPMSFLVRNGNLYEIPGLPGAKGAAGDPAKSPWSFEELLVAPVWLSDDLKFQLALSQGDSDSKFT